MTETQDPRYWAQLRLTQLYQQRAEELTDITRAAFADLAEAATHYNNAQMSNLIETLAGVFEKYAGQPVIPTRLDQV